MKARGVHLQYSFEPQAQPGASVQNPLFDLLAAVREHGSIQRAAAATGASYRHVWGALKRWEEVLGQALVTWVQGHPARLTPFAERLLWAEAGARARMTPHIEALRAELERALAEALDGSQQLLTVYASHDPALSLLRSRAQTAERLHLDLRFTGCVDALRALSEGRCQVAAFHLPALADGGASATALYAQALKPWLKADRHRFIACTQRVQGLIVPVGNPQGLLLLADVAAQRARFALRQTGSATRLLTEHLLAREQLDPVRLVVSRTEDSPGAVAAAVAAGLADVGVGTESAAREQSLDFVPLVAEEFFLVCTEEALEQPAVQALRRTLHDTIWQQAASALPGCTLPRPGAVLSLADALPWWGPRKARG